MTTSRTVAGRIFCLSIVEFLANRVKNTSSLSTYETSFIPSSFVRGDNENFVKIFLILLANDQKYLSLLEALINFFQMLSTYLVFDWLTDLL